MAKNIGIIKEKGEGMKIYEVGYLLAPSLPEEKLFQLVEDLKDAIVKDGGAIITEEFPKLRDLAYQISKIINRKKEIFGSALFGSVKFELEAENISNIKKHFESNEAVIRFLLITTVRENTMYLRRGVFRASDRPRADKPMMSEEEMEKTIATLVSE
ncbi:MAG: 30S ribosomal protein S6 [Patescibacteria group bacterium]